ncbi:DedA family protein [Alkalihalobacillus pseudalcaliphilus]|uniref:DedA family protein n=1 Tax=Alkalihalobacillus pseudalcaliphilus TaxID=79884 RepID=UPI00064D9E68|nr:DedA family protein [Alkalihalobacillus pseudalcaliphilus]KMK78092.1 alkaline phosphatase [Alkalihalobacillus pseudalcaliphilus]
METWMIQLMEDLGYIGILILIAVENLFPPIPSEIILSFGGFMTTQSDMTLTGVITFATIGSLIGAVILYWIGSFLGVERLEKLIDRYGHFIRLKRNDLYRANDWFTRFGPWAVFFCRLVPLLRSIISIPAGMAKMNLLLFIVLSTVGSLLWNTLIVMVGAKVGESWDSALIYFDAYAKVIYIVLASLIIFVVILFILKRFRRK